uniref:Uncharacterized protein n=1 Tax=Eutreptiella gymnastica TaxID=73025 RepID=A0A7S4CND5_9EUGL
MVGNPVYLCNAVAGAGAVGVAVAVAVGVGYYMALGNGVAAAVAVAVGNGDDAAIGNAVAVATDDSIPVALDYGDDVAARTGAALNALRPLLMVVQLVQANTPPDALCECRAHNIIIQC